MKRSEKAKKSKSKSGNQLAVVIFVIIGAVCGFIGGIFFIKNLTGDINTRVLLIVFAEIIVSMYLAIFLQIIIHEGGHFVFGKASGYKFVSFRVGSMMLVSDAGKYKLKKFTIVGTGGQCLMMPPECDGYNFPYILYNLGGSLANIAFGSLCLLLYLAFNPIKLISIFLILTFVIGIAFALMNGIPLQLGGIANDGHNAVSLGKDKEARHAFWLQLHINGLIASGMRLRDMPSFWFEFPDNADLSNPMICYIGVLRCSYLHDKRQFDEARELCNYLIKSAPGTLEILKNELRCELLFYEIIGLCRKDEIEKMYSKPLSKYIKATWSYVSRKRLLYAYELLVKHDEEEAQKQLKAFEKVCLTYPYTSEVESERELIEFINTHESNLLILKGDSI